MNGQPEYSKDYRGLGLHHGHESRIGAARHWYDKLQGALEVLPRVDENGHSDCPFAKQLYRQKYEAEQEVASAIDELRIVAQAIAAEVQRAQGAVARMDGARMKIHGTTVRQFMGGLLDAEKEQLRKATLQGQDVAHWSEALAAVLAESRTKPWPFSEPMDAPAVDAMLDIYDGI